jgi:hypothetical protein
MDVTSNLSVIPQPPLPETAPNGPSAAPRGGHYLEMGLVQGLRLREWQRRDSVGAGCEGQGMLDYTTNPCAVQDFGLIGECRGVC